MFRLNRSQWATLKWRCSGSRADGQDTIVVGVDKSLAMLKHCTGYFEGDTFIDTSDKLEVWAVQDGTIVKYDGDPTKIQPVIKVRGRYRDFALLETPTLGMSDAFEPCGYECL
jgi:nicotinic acid phosphoribosyltransferase